MGQVNVSNPYPQRVLANSAPSATYLKQQGISKDYQWHENIRV